MDKWAPGAHANTFGGNPLCCAAALATLDLVKNGYAENAQRMGQRMMERLTAFAKQFDLIGDIRGRGLMIGVEFVTDRATKTPAKAFATQVVNRAFQNGLLLLECGASGIRLIPPLMIDAKRGRRRHEPPRESMAKRWRRRAELKGTSGLRGRFARWPVATCLAALAGLLASQPSLAQRQAVLKQIDVPHNYYFREMYLPQLTSGPSSLAFSPDGRTLVYSMQGSLWKQALDSTTARATHFRAQATTFSPTGRPTASHRLRPLQRRRDGARAAGRGIGRGHAAHAHTCREC